MTTRLLRFLPSLEDCSHLDIVTEDKIRGAHALSSFDLDFLDQQSAFARRDDDPVLVESHHRGRLVRLIGGGLSTPNLHQLAAARRLQITECAGPWIERANAIPEFPCR